jgi:AraC-like DNA-binding protein
MQKGTFMKLEDINPHIRFAQEIRLGTQENEHIAFDTHLYYVISGNGAFVCDDEKYIIKNNSLLLVPAGVRYRFIADGTLSLISVNFDYTKAKSDIVAPMLPKAASEFETSMITEKGVFDDFDALSSFLKLENARDMATDFTRLTEEFLYKKKFYSELSSAIVKRIIFKILRALATDKKAEKKAELILSYIRENYAQKISNVHIAETFGYHPYHVNRLVKASTGMTVHKYLSFIRIEAAKRFLCETDKSVTEISELCGYEGLCTFSREFKLKVGKTPGEYRRNTAF